MLENENTWTDDCGESDNFASYLIEKSQFVDVLCKYDIEYYNAGYNAYKIRCPFHMNGNERTPSLNISLDKNLFNCFACSRGGSIIDFVMLYKGMPKFEAMKEIAKISGLSDSVDGYDIYVPRDINHTLLPHIFKAGVEIREFLKSISHSDQYPMWKKRTDKWLARFDFFLMEMDDDQWETVKNYCDKVVKVIADLK